MGNNADTCIKHCEENAKIRGLTFCRITNIEKANCVHESKQRFKCTYEALDKDKNIVERVYFVIN